MRLRHRILHNTLAVTHIYCFYWICRVPRAASSEPSVLLNVATHSDGTITYSFGAGDEVPPVVASIPLATPNVLQETPEATTSKASEEINGASTTAVATVTAVQQLDKLLHLTPEVGSNGTSLPINGNGASSNGNGAGKPHKIEEVHKEEETKIVEDDSVEDDQTIAVAKKLSQVAAENRRKTHEQMKAASATPSTHSTTENGSAASSSTSSSSSSNKGPLTPQTISYRDAPAVTVDRLYSKMCDSGRLDDALLVVKECIRAGREDVLKM